MTFNDDTPKAAEIAEKGYNYDITDSVLTIRMRPPNSHILPYFPQYHIDQPTAGINVNYQAAGDNATGHQQIGFLSYWTTRAFIESGGGVGLDLGSAGIRFLGCLSTDLFGNEEKNLYGGKYDAVHMKIDGAKRLPFETDQLSCVIASHLTEHLSCLSLPADATISERIKTRCIGSEIIPILREWIRVIRRGGYLCLIVPDDEPSSRVGSSTFLDDETHQHAWTADAFYRNVIFQLLDLVDVVEFSTFNNNFSFNLVAVKK